jgi:PAS domain S-box-containing protein
MVNDAGPGSGGDASGSTVPVSASATVDAEGLVTGWSAGARRLLGYPPTEVVGRPVRGLLADRLSDRVRRRIDAGDEWVADIAVRHHDGHRAELRVRAHAMLDGRGATQWFVTATGPRQAGGALPGSAPELEGWTLAQLPIPVAVYDRDIRLTAANAAMSRLLGMPLDEHLGRRLKDIMPTSGFEEFDRLQEQVVRTGETLRLESYARAPGDTREHAWSMFFFPLRDEAGQVRGVSAAVFDTTEQYWARRRLAIVNEASTSVGSTLDVTRTAQELAEVAAGRFADFVSVDLFDSVTQGEEPDIASMQASTGAPLTLRRAAQQSVLDDCPESAVAVGETGSYPPYSPPARALAMGRASRHSVMHDPTVQRWLEADPLRARGLHEHRVHSLMVVPLRARGTTLGFALFLRHRSPDAFDSDDLLLAEEITARAAVCIDNARRYTRERTTALTLQRSMLPHRMPRQAAVEVASRYLPAVPRAGIGGDWFDVIPLSGARVALVVGDVVGHGIHASATMGRLRTAVRTLADVDLTPDELLTQLDDLVVRLDTEEGQGTGGHAARVAGEIGATCLYAVYDPVTRRCTIARAGHPLPAVVLPDGSTQVLDLPAGPPLGLGGLPFEATEIELPEGSVLALYTDGLIESAGRDVDAGLGLLRRALTRPAASLDETCDHVLEALLPERPIDDIALLVARTRSLDARQVVTWDLPPDPAVVADARKWVAEQLADWSLDELVFTTELVVSELVTNAIRYAGGPIQLRLIQDTALICEVSDTSSTAPHLRRARTFDEGGRGLLLVAQLTQRWGSRQTQTGKTIWAEQPLPYHEEPTAPEDRPAP